MVRGFLRLKEPLGIALTLLIAARSDVAAALNISDAGSYAEGTVQPAKTDSDSSILQPFSTDEPSTTLFTRYSTLSTLAPVINVADELLTTPIPTNKWWANLISATVGDDTVAVPAFANPYTLELPRAEAPYGLQMCYSYTYRETSDVAADGSIEYYLHEFHNDLTLSATEFTARPDYEIYSWTDTGATLRTCVTGTTNCMDSALINGMAFVSATYTGLTPSIQSEYTMTLASSDATTGKYVLQLSNAQTWVLYASDTSATFTIDSTGMALVASGVYSGTLRLAILPAGSDSTLYDNYTGCIVRGGNVDVTSRTEYSINWQTNGTTCESNGLFHFALKHHLDSFASDAGVTTTTISLNSTTRGAMTGVVTTTAEWAFTEPEDDAEVDFFPTTDITADQVTQTNLLAALQADIAATWAMNAESWYYNGKYYQKYATLCLMASNTNIVGSDTTLLTTCLEKLETLITPFLTNTLEPPLAYETVYSGLVSSMTFTSNDVNVDFGNAVYNDHHYHYGYWVTASAILLKLDPDWTGAAALETMIWTMLRDVANPSTQDTYFPRFRHFSWYLGHSVSHGVTPMADGKDEESTSEDINLYYGMKLWGQVMGNQAVEDLGSLMMRVDARAVRTYFLMLSDNTLHPAGFVKNHVTGIFFDNKAHYTTWFSSEKYCIHGIQMIPVSPINALARTSTFVQQEWDDILSKETIVTGADMTNAWLSLLLVNEAFIDQSDALSKLPTATLDDGLTLSWALYNAATRGGSTTSTTTTTTTTTTAPAVTTATPVVTATPVAA